MSECDWSSSEPWYDLSSEISHENLALVSRAIYMIHDYLKQLSVPDRYGVARLLLYVDKSIDRSAPCFLKIASKTHIT